MTFVTLPAGYVTPSIGLGRECFDALSRSGPEAYPEKFKAAVRGRAFRVEAVHDDEGSGASDFDIDDISPVACGMRPL